MVKTIKKAFILVVGITTCGFFQSVTAGTPPPAEENIVISLQSNPMSDPERACLAVTFARMLSGNNNGDVTLFVTLDGVTLADESVVSRPRFKCDVPESMDSDGKEDGVMSIRDNLEAFLGDMVVCPICWDARYEEAPDYGIKKNPRQMILDADKILDF